MSTAPADLSTLVLGGGFVIGVSFGAVATRINFCTMGALSDIVNMGHWGRMRVWLLAIAVAVLGTTALSWAGLVDLGKSVPQRPVLPWLSLLLGGLLFGVGMTLAGGCANRNLLRLGAGSVRSLVVLVFMGLASYMTLKGLLAQWRSTLLDPVAIPLADMAWPNQGLPTLLSRLTGLDARVALLTVAAVLVLALLFFVFKDAGFRRQPLQVGAAVVLGALIPAGWYVTGHLGFGENPETLENVYFATNSRTLESMSFVAPIAYALELLMLWTDRSLRLSFGVATALGVVVGAAAVSLATGRFRWEGFASLQDLRDQLLGAVLMGFGGVTAMGCTIGQGLSGLSTLAIGSFIAVAGIVAGCVATLKWMLWRVEREA